MSKQELIYDLEKLDKKLVENINPTSASYELPFDPKTIFDQDTAVPYTSYKENINYILRKYFKRRSFRVKETNDLPPHILGMTDTSEGFIWLRKLYGELKKKVLKHEIFHNLYKYLPELRIREKENDPLNLDDFELIPVYD